MPVVGRAWAKRYLGFDPASEASNDLLNFAYRADNAAGRLDLAAPENLEALQQTLIEYNPFAASTSATTTLLQPGPAPSKALKNIPWPKGTAPTPSGKVTGTASQPLPRCDALVVTWTTAEAQALSQVLTPGHFSTDAWKHYTHRFDWYEKRITGPHAPAKFSKRLGSYWLTKIAGKSVLCFKSELHLDQDGPAAPIKDLMQQILGEVRPEIFITTGTAGGIGATTSLGDVVATGDVAFDCTTNLKLVFTAVHISYHPSKGAIIRKPFG